MLLSEKVRVCELLGPYEGSIRTSPYGDRLAATLAEARFCTGDVEGAIRAVRAGAASSAHHAARLGETLEALEQIYGDLEPREPSLRATRRMIRTMQEADACWQRGDAAGAVRALEHASRLDGRSLGVLARLSEAMLANDPATPADVFQKIEVLATFTYVHGVRVVDSLPLPVERMTPAAIDALARRARAWLDELGEGPREPDWVTEIDAALEEAPPTGARLVWKLSEEEQGWCVRPYVQRLRPDQGFTAGQRLRSSRELDPAVATPIDRAALELLGRAEAGGGDSLAELLELLAGQPLLLIGSATLDVRHERPVLVLRVQEGRVIARVRTGHVERSPSELLERIATAPKLAEIDAANARATLVEFLLAHVRILRVLAEQTLPPLRIVERRLARLGTLFELDLDEALRGTEIAADERLLLRMQWSGSSLAVVAFVRPVAGGPAYAPGEGAEVAVGVVDGAVVHVRRQAERERARAVRQCAQIDLATSEGDPLRWLFAGREAALAIVARVSCSPEQYVIEWEGAPLEVVHPLRAAALKVQVESVGARWLAVDGRLEVDESAVALGELLAAVRGGRRFVRIEAGRFAELEERLRRWVEELDALAHERDGRTCVGVAAAPLLRELEGTLEGDDVWRALVERLRASEEPAVLPEGISAVLRGYQREGVQWMARMAAAGIGACLADDMGLGKTLQALALASLRAARGPALVVAPTSVLHQWKEEAARHAPELRVIVHHGASRSLPALGPGDLVVTSYGVVVQDRDELCAVRFATLFLDEAQQIKNPRARRTGAVRALEADAIVALTGTPIENHLGELWSLFSAVEPSLLGSWQAFRRKFALAIERDADERARARLSRLLRGFVLRRTKAEVLPELPPRTTSTMKIELTPSELAVYEAARAHALELLEGGSDARFMLLAALTRLRQIACDVRLVDPTADVPSSKLRALVELVSELKEAGHRVLVFSQFVTLLERARDELEGVSVRCAMLTGSTNASERLAVVDELTCGRADALLVSLKAGGTGLNVTAASYVIHLDPWWNPAVEDQASDRAHRIGQTRAVNVIRLVSAGTIEEAVLAQHEEKRALVDGVLAGTDVAGSLPLEELGTLLRYAP